MDVCVCFFSFPSFIQQKIVFFFCLRFPQWDISLPHILLPYSDKAKKSVRIVFFVCLFGASSIPCVYGCPFCGKSILFHVPRKQNPIINVLKCMDISNKPQPVKFWHWHEFQINGLNSRAQFFQYIRRMCVAVWFAFFFHSFIYSSFFNFWKVAIYIILTTFPISSYFLSNQSMAYEYQFKQTKQKKNERK